jgi:ankyrin repeat protein
MSIVTIRLILGIFVDSQNEKKETPLHKAVKMKNLHATNILLKNRANYSIEDL